MANKSAANVLERVQLCTPRRRLTDQLPARRIVDERDPVVLNLLASATQRGPEGVARLLEILDAESRRRLDASAAPPVKSHEDVTMHDADELVPGPSAASKDLPVSGDGTQLLPLDEPHAHDPANPVISVSPLAGQAGPAAPSSASGDGLRSWLAEHPPAEHPPAEHPPAEHPPAEHPPAEDQPAGPAPALKRRVKVLRRVSVSAAPCLPPPPPSPQPHNQTLSNSDAPASSASPQAIADQDPTDPMDDIFAAFIASLDNPPTRGASPPSQLE